MIILGTYTLGESKEDGKTGFKYSIVYRSNNNININFLDIDVLHEKFSTLIKEEKDHNLVEDKGWAENIEDMVETIINNYPGKSTEIYLAPTLNISLDIDLYNLNHFYRFFLVFLQLLFLLPLLLLLVLNRLYSLRFL